MLERDRDILRAYAGRKLDCSLDGDLVDPNVVVDIAAVALREPVRIRFGAIRLVFIGVDGRPLVEGSAGGLAV